MKRILLVLALVLLVGCAKFSMSEDRLYHPVSRIADLPREIDGYFRPLENRWVSEGHMVRLEEGLWNDDAVLLHLITSPRGEDARGGGALEGDYSLTSDGATWNLERHFVEERGKDGLQEVLFFRRIEGEGTSPVSLHLESIHTSQGDQAVKENTVQELALTDEEGNFPRMHFDLNQEIGTFLGKPVRALSMRLSLLGGRVYLDTPALDSHYELRLMARDDSGHVCTFEALEPTTPRVLYAKNFAYISGTSQSLEMRLEGRKGKDDGFLPIGRWMALPLKENAKLSPVEEHTVE